MRFTDGELKVMQLLWKHGELKPAELQALFAEPIKNPALRSYLTILMDKGHVSRRKVGKAFVYKAKTQRQRVFSRLVSELIETFCEGSAAQLMLKLVEREPLTPDQLAELKAASELNEESQSLEKTLQKGQRKSCRMKD